MSTDQVGRFFDALTSDYTATIERCFPRYREMLWALLYYLPPDRSITSILELGCGTGNLSVLVHNAFPNAKLHVVDVSEESLDVCRTRLQDAGTVRFEQQDFRNLSCPDGGFDLILSSIAIHHLTSVEKQSLFRQCHAWLSEEGTLAFADQCSGATSDMNARHIDHWKELSMGAGSSTEEWNMWMEHQAKHDHHDTLGNHLKWLGEAGFPIVDCQWRFLLWSVIHARK